jgi:hypothetical protein
MQKDELMTLLESMDSKMQLTLEAVSCVDHKTNKGTDLFCGRGEVKREQI